MALSYYQQAVKFDQHYGMAWFRTGQILEQLSRTDEARHAYGNAVRASPDLAEAHLRFGILSYRAGDLEAALHSLSRVEQIAPNTDMADEARKYLEKLNVVTRSSPSSAQDDMVNSEPAPVHPEIPGETQAPVVTKAPVPMMEAPRLREASLKVLNLNPFDTWSRLAHLWTGRRPMRQKPASGKRASAQS